MKNKGVKRLRGLIIDKPFMYGTIAKPLTKKIEGSEHTHEWCAFVRGKNNEDISCFIKKVVFNLHPSFENPKRSKFEWMT